MFLAQVGLEPNLRYLLRKSKNGQNTKSIIDERSRKPH